jgi:predicted CoA-binding protein
VIFVTPPQVTLEIIPLVKELGINKVRMQPWAEHPDAVKFCEEHSIECQYNACIMVARRTTEATMK